MKAIFKYKLIHGILFCLLISASTLGQITYGKITYERKTNLYKRFKDWPDVKEWIKESDKSKVDIFELYFNDTLTAFKPQESDIKEQLDWATVKNVVYQNTKENKRITFKKIWGEEFIMQDSLWKRRWKITDSKRVICGYTCRKAVWQANDSTRIYAWYCNEIENSIGPESFSGLPGAILGLATEDGGVIYFAKSVEVIKPDPLKMLPGKIRQKIYATSELKAQLEKDFGKEKWGKVMIANNFGVW